MIVASVPEAVVMRLRTRFRRVLQTQMVFRWLSFCRQASLSCSGDMEPVSWFPAIASTSRLTMVPMSHIIGPEREGSSLAGVSAASLPRPLGFAPVWFQSSSTLPRHGVTCLVARSWKSRIANTRLKRASDSFHQNTQILSVTETKFMYPQISQPSKQDFS